MRYAVIDIKDWRVALFVLEGGDECAERAVVDTLKDAGCRIEDLEEAVSLMEEEKLNTGFTFTNDNTLCAVMVLGVASNASEFANTFSHEVCHLSRHIAESIGVSADAEEFAYLTGGVTQQIYPHVRRFLCPHCRG